MKTWIHPIALAAALLLLQGPGLRADDSKGPDDRLRASLKDTLLQLRQAQTDLANLQATQAAQADEDKALKDQVALLKKHSVEDRAESSKALDALKAKEAEQASEIAKLETSLAVWKDAADKMNAAIKQTEEERNKSQTDAGMLARKVDDLKAKNAELYRLAKEILKRYHDFSLGDQFEAREPFIGSARARLETLIQDYDDQIAAQKAKAQP
jgi:chromosome segregation ATPase